MTDKIDDIIAGMSRSERHAVSGDERWPKPPYETNPLPGLHRTIVQKRLRRFDGTFTPFGQQVRTRLQETKP